MTSSGIGSDWERKVTAWLVGRGLPAFRLRGNEGPKDHGDIGGFGLWALDCKDQAKMSLGSWVAQAKKEAINSHKPLSAVIVKRRGKPTEEALVIMDLATFARLENYITQLREDAQ